MSSESKLLLESFFCLQKMNEEKESDK